MKSEEEIRKEMEEARELARELDGEGQHLNSLATKFVFRSLMWALDEGADEIDDELLKIDQEL